MSSRLQDMVEAEAARAEAESPDEPTGDEEDEAAAEEPAEPELEPEPDEPSMEAQLRAFESENRRHERALAKLMGEDFAAFETCDTCAGVGFRPTVAMRFDSKLEQCATCAGHGYMLTHSVREDRVVRECEDCQGNGYRYVAPALPEATAVPERSVVRFDPYTGLPLAEAAASNGGDAAGWAPGYTPPGAPAPAPAPAR